MRQVIIFAICFAIGATAALIGRSAFHKPYAEPTVAAPSTNPQPQSHASPTRDGHAQHGTHEATPAVQAEDPPRTETPAAGASPSTASTGSVVNSICPSCGMDVDTEIPPIAYGDKAIGVGCAPCIPKIKRDLERHGQAALRNEKVK